MMFTNLVGRIHFSHTLQRSFLFTVSVFLEWLIKTINRPWCSSQYYSWSCQAVKIISTALLLFIKPHCHSGNTNTVISQCLQHTLWQHCPHYSKERNSPTAAAGGLITLDFIYGEIFVSLPCRGLSLPPILSAPCCWLSLLWLMTYCWEFWLFLVSQVIWPSIWLSFTTFPFYHSPKLELFWPSTAEHIYHLSYSM